MSSVRPMLVRGNGKLGESIHHFDLPAVKTCPGRSDLCERLCYATRGRFTMPPATRRYAGNLRQSRLHDFAEQLINEIRRKGVVVCRFHVSGDFYSPDYASKCLEVMRACPRVQFYFYTRSWRVVAIAPLLWEMAQQPNCQVWFSVDEETGLPAWTPHGVRLAYMQTSEYVSEQADLIFRLRRLRRQSRIELPMVCPEETPTGHAQGVNCGSCGHCWR